MIMYLIMYNRSSTSTTETRSRLAMSFMKDSNFPAIMVVKHSCWWPHPCNPGLMGFIAMILFITIILCQDPVSGCALIRSNVICYDLALPAPRPQCTFFRHKVGVRRETESERKSWMGHSTGIHRHPWFSLLLVTVLLLHPLCGERRTKTK